MISTVIPILETSDDVVLGLAMECASKAIMMADQNDSGEVERGGRWRRQKKEEVVVVEKGEMG